MTPAEIEGAAHAAARQAFGREPTPAEVTRTLAVWCCHLDRAVSGGYLRRPAARPTRMPKAPPPAIDGVRQ